VTEIVVDTSAIIAILRLETEEILFQQIIGEAVAIYISAVSVQEASMVLAGRSGGETAFAPLDDLIHDLEFEIVPHDYALARIAREAFLRFGKGRHPAGLNCGDCASYALAKSRNLPLLFKGADFARTDLVAASA
jgi:ribonuclease VapC